MMTTTMKIYPIKKLTVLPTWETLSKLSSTEMKTRGKKIWKVNHILVTCLTSFNRFTSKSDQHLISPYNITLESHIKVVRIIGMITNYRSSWLLTNDILTSRSITIILQKTTHLTWKENLEPKLFTFTSWINTSNWNIKIHILLKNNFLGQKGYIYAQSTNTPSDFLSLAWPVITLYQK